MEESFAVERLLLYVKGIESTKSKHYTSHDTSFHSVMSHWLASGLRKQKASSRHQDLFIRTMAVVAAKLLPCWRRLQSLSPLTKRWGLTIDDTLLHLAQKFGFGASFAMNRTFCEMPMSRISSLITSGWCPVCMHCSNKLTSRTLCHLTAPFFDARHPFQHNSE